MLFAPFAEVVRRSEELSRRIWGLRSLSPKLLACLLTAIGCSGPGPSAGRSEINVATAANLTRVFAELGQMFERQTGVHVVYSFGATAQLAQQIAHGAPYDVFASADTEHVDELARQGLILSGTSSVYARGKLVLWIPDARTPAGRLEDLARPGVSRIAIANPKLAPYGRAAEESLRALHLWEKIQPRVVFAENVSMATQYASTGNADAAFTALALVYDRPGRRIAVPESLHNPIDQAVAVLRGSTKPELARKFVQFITSQPARDVMKRYGYD